MSSRPAGKIRLIFDIIVIYGTLAAILVGVVLWIASAGGGSGEDPADYSSCAELATSPGTDVNSARCVDDSGDVVDYKDSEYGQAVTDLANQ